MTSTLLDQASIARLNRTAVFDALRNGGPCSRTELVRRTLLTKATISGIVDVLVRDGLVREIGEAARRGPGRPARLLAYVADAHLVAGVHLGVRSTHVVLADGNGTPVDEVVLATPPGSPVAALSAAERAVRELSKGRGGLAGIGICLPGRVDSETGWCHRAPNLGWVDVPIGAPLSHRLGVPVFVVNDAGAALIAEHESGACMGFDDDVVLLYAGDGVSAAVLSRGELFAGASGASGEIGHCPIPGATGACGCGRIGCLETECSTGAVLSNVRASLAVGDASSLSRGPLTAERVLDAARAGDEVAVAAVRSAGRRLGEAAGVLINLFNPALVVLAGELSRAGDLIADPLREVASQVALPGSFERAQIRVAAHGADAEVMGAVAVALRRMDPLAVVPGQVAG